MAETLVELVAKITADATELKKGLGEATRGVQSWVKENEKQFKAVGVALTGVGASIVGSLGMMTKAAIDEEINIKRLGVALKGVGVNYDDVKDSLESVILATQKKTGIADDQQRDILGRLILVTKDYEKALNLLPLALDMAAAGQMDGTTAATYLAKAYEELEGGAEEIGIRLGQATVKFKDLNEVQKLVGGTAEATANPLSVLKASMGDLAEKIGSFLIPVLKSVVDKVVPIIEKVQAWTDAHPELARVLIILAAVLGGVALVLGPILIMLPMLVASLTLLLGPIGLVVAAFMGLIAIGTLIVLNWETIKTKTIEIWNGIAIFFGGIWDTIVDFFKTNWDKILAILFPAIGIPILIARNWETIKEKTIEIWDNIASFFGGVWNTIVGFFKDNWEKILAILFPAVGIPILIAQHWEPIVDFFKGLWTRVTQTVTDWVQTIKNFLISLNPWDWIKEKWEGLLDGIKGILDKIFGHSIVEDWAQGLAKYLGDVDLKTPAYKMFGGITDAAASELSKTIDTVKGTLAELKARVGLATTVPERGEAIRAFQEARLNAANKLAAETGITSLQAQAQLGAPVPAYMLQEGGIVTQPTLAMLGEAGAEAVIPLNEAGGMGDITINFTQPVFFDREDTMNKFVDMIRKGIQRQDRIRFGGAYNG